MHLSGPGVQTEGEVMSDDSQTSADGTQHKHEGGLRQVVRDRTNIPDSPLGELIRFVRELTKDAQRRSK